MNSGILEVLSCSVALHCPLSAFSVCAVVASRFRILQTPRLNRILSVSGLVGAVLEELVDQAILVREKSYAPYSKFQVGAALLCDDGTIITGCNVENAVYPLGNCAERTAIHKAVSEGHRKFKAIAIAAHMDKEFVGPCGACRQTLREFGSNIEVYMVKAESREMAKTDVQELLPFMFPPRETTFRGIKF
ncbi:unnamed protein product [Cyprideis torosa]|uniref:Cytidine deaminase n=1 Tax=Cyprideis torosa TaxID=163714 RepID=A0A7R8W2U7_9CRUS|nr:unnamed protein product [Cyprideis torosa]CAG0879014.1 unnamed protein product [Cyprideis torosa]